MFSIQQSGLDESEMFMTCNPLGNIAPDGHRILLLLVARASQVLDQPKTPVP